MTKNTSYTRDIRLLEKLISSCQSEVMRSYLIQYMRAARPYYIAKRQDQITAAPNGRKCDLIGGFPFTSQSHPWPYDEDYDEYLQPIVQLNLEKTGRLLNEDLGSGILQVWGYSVAKHRYLRFFTRVIDKISLRSLPDQMAPQKVASAIEFPSEWVAKPKLLWRGAGRMFRGTFEHLNCTESADEIFASDSFLTQEPDTDTNDADPELIDLIESWGPYWESEVIQLIQNVPYFGTYLGGHGGNNGSLGRFLNVDQSNEILIFRLTSREDEACMGIVATKDESGNLLFQTQETFM